VRRLALFLIVAIIAIGAVVGLAGLSKNGATSSSTAANYGLSSGSPFGNSGSYPPSDSTQPVASSSASQVAITLSTVVSESSSSQSVPSTISLNPGSSSSSSAQNSPQAENSTARNGFIEFFSNVTLEVTSSQSALSKAEAIAYTYGGYPAFSSYSNISSVAVLRIPASNYVQALSQVEGLGNLTGQSSYSNDVSIQYTDLNATLQSLLTEQASLLRLENSSNSLNATLLLEGQIQNVDAQINQIQSQILQTRLLVDYSTITATFNVRVPGPALLPLNMKLTATPVSGLSPLSVTFNAIVSGGSEPYIVNYNFGDGSSYQGQSLIHTFASAGTFNVTVTATDALGNAIENFTIIHVTQPPATNEATSFGSYAFGLLVSVVEGIIEVAVVLLPIALVVGIVLIPFRNRLRAAKKNEIKS